MAAKVAAVVAAAALIWVAVACGGSDLRSATNDDLAQFELTGDDVGPPYSRTFERTNDNVSDIVFQAPDGNSCVQSEIQILTGVDYAEHDLATVKDIRQGVTMDIAGEELVSPTGLPVDAVEIHRIEDLQPACLGKAGAEAWEVIFTRSNALVLTTVVSLDQNDAQLVTTVASSQARRMEQLLKN